MRWWLGIALIAASSPASAGPPDGLPASLTVVDGGAALDPAAWKGKVVLLQFWATFCEPCREAEPFYASLQARFGGRGLVLVAVDEGEDAAVVKAYLKEHPKPFRAALDRGGALAKALRLRGQPAWALFDSRGDLVASAVGFTPSAKADLEWRVDRLLPPENGSVPVGAFERPR